MELVLVPKRARVQSYGPTGLHGLGAISVELVLIGFHNYAESAVTRVEHVHIHPSVEHISQRETGAKAGKRVADMDGCPLVGLRRGRVCLLHMLVHFSGVGWLGDNHDA